MESRKTPPNTETPLSVSVVIPAHNSAAYIGQLLPSLFAQTYPRFEIILVDDGSSDATAAVAEQALARWGGAGRVLRQRNGGPGSARNAGLRASSADAIAFIDADCVADPDWLASLTQALASGATGAGGFVRTLAPTGWVASYLDACQFYRQRVRHGVVEYLLTANAAFRREALAYVGGFTERPGVWAEDADLSFRLKRQGYTLALAHGGAVTHAGAPTSPLGLARTLYRYGFGSAALSHVWRNGRTPAVELIRHAGAAALAPWLALRLRRRVGLARALSYWPLIALEHASFCWGLCAASLRGVGEKGA